MVSANLNFTGRQRIRLDMFEFELNGRMRPVLVIRKLDLSELALDQGWPIWLEGRARDYFHREPLGTVGQPATGERALPPDAFVPGRSVRWRLLVVDVVDPHHRIAAMAERIRLVSQIQRRQQGASLLRVSPAQLGQLPWRVDLDAKGFLLLINDRLPAPTDLPGRPDVAPWVLPAALREILMRLWPGADESIEEDIREPWLALAAKSGSPPPDGSGVSWSDWMEWVDEAVCGFSTEHELSEKLLSRLERED